MKQIYRFFLLSPLFLFFEGVSAQQEQCRVDVQCMGNGSGCVFQSSNVSLNRCGQQDWYNRYQTANYLIRPDYGSRLSHLYVNNVDRMNDVHSAGSGTSASIFSFSFGVGTSTSLQPIFTLEGSTDAIPVIITCMGTGTGRVARTDEPDDDLCGVTDTYMPDFVASYDFLPGQESILSHLYVNNVDRLGDVQTLTSGSSTSYRLGFAVTSAVSMIPVFDQPVGIRTVGNELSCSLFPNPTEGRAVLTVSGVQGTVEVTVCGVGGTVVARQQVSVSPTGRKVELEGLPRGVYFVRVDSSEGSRTMKLIVR